jgi:hypothetical protein
MKENMGDQVNAPFDVKPYLYSIVVLPLDRFLACVKFLAFVNIFTACITSP